MDERAKIAHALRRFGLGAGREELERYVPLGLEGTLARLIDYDDVDERFDVEPYDLCFNDEGEYEAFTYPIALWWSLRLVTTQRPLQERLTLFWHDHFAIDGEQTDDGMASKLYLDALRDNAAGRFDQMLGDVCRTPAMIKFLNLDTSYRHQPNENFARELLELFTTGVGSYGEEDLREVARAFTGWKVVDVRYQGGDSNERRRQAAERGESLLFMADVPAQVDSGRKNVLGHEGDWGPDDVMRLALEHPNTARYVGGKLWKHFVGVAPTATELEGIANTFRESDWQIRPVLWKIAESDAFWDPKNVRSRARNPFEFTTAWMRAFGLNEPVRAVAEDRRDPKARRIELRETGGLAYWLYGRQGAWPLYPPNVAGWGEPEEFINPATSIVRNEHGGSLFWAERARVEFRQLVAQRLHLRGDTQSPERFARAMLEEFDVPAHPELVARITERVTAEGGMEALNDQDRRGYMVVLAGSMIVAAPESQLS